MIVMNNINVCDNCNDDRKPKKENSRNTHTQNLNEREKNSEIVVKSKQEKFLG